MGDTRTKIGPNKKRERGGGGWGVWYAFAGKWAHCLAAFCSDKTKRSEHSKERCSPTLAGELKISCFPRAMKYPHIKVVGLLNLFFAPPNYCRFYSQFEVLFGIIIKVIIIITQNRRTSFKKQIVSDKIWSIKRLNIKDDKIWAFCVKKTFINIFRLQKGKFWNTMWSIDAAAFGNISTHITHHSIADFFLLV